MIDNLTISYEEFSEGGIKVLTVARGDEAIEMFEGNIATMLYHVLIGEDTISMEGEEYKIES